MHLTMNCIYALYILTVVQFISQDLVQILNGCKVEARQAVLTNWIAEGTPSKGLVGPD